MLEFTVLMEESIRGVSPEIGEILDSEVFRKLREQGRHFYSNTYDHSVRVAYMAGSYAKKWGIDEAETVKAALLHDFCDRGERDIDVCAQKGFYLFSHPVAAAINADYYFGINREQKDAILAHMFPGAFFFPTTRMAWAIIKADKLAASYETFFLPRALRRAAA